MGPGGFACLDLSAVLEADLFCSPGSRPVLNKLPLDDLILKLLFLCWHMWIHLKLWLNDTSHDLLLAVASQRQMVLGKKGLSFHFFF